MDREPTAADIIARLELRPHPEGGYYRETFRDCRTDAQGRACSTAIYFLLSRGDRSHWHRIDAAEVWHYYAGSALSLRIANDGCRPHAVRLGPISCAASGRRRSCPHPPGKAPKPPATGRWSDARWHRDSNLRTLNWPRRDWEPC